MNIVRQTVYILLLTVLLATLHGLCLDRETWEGKEPGALTLNEAWRMSDVLWIDARPRDAFEIEHYQGALHLNEDDWESGLEALLMSWEPDRPIIVYCDGGGCESSRSVFLRLRKELGMDTIFWLKGGWEELKAEGIEQ